MSEQKAPKLGRGLGTLLSAPVAEPEREPRIEISVDSIVANRFQPRREFSADSIQTLAASIKENGLLQPIVLRRVPSGFELIAGERRLRAMRLLGRTTTPAVIREASDDQMLQLALIENLQRSDLNAIEKALAFRDLAQRFSLTQEEIARRTGLDRSTVTNFMRLLELQREIQDMVSRGTMSMGHARCLLGVVSPEDRIRLAHRIVAESLSVRKTENIVGRMVRPSAGKTPSGTTQGDSQLRAIEDRLRRAFGVKITIVAKRRGGSIVIEYSSNDDLNRIISKIVMD